MIIGIHGAMGSGKDTIAKILMDKFIASGTTKKVIRKAHADSLKNMVAVLTGVSVETLYTEEGKNNHCPSFNMTYGQLLQQLGTNVLRNWDPEVWMKALYAGYDDDTILLVPDVRFPNEAQEVLNRGGILVKVVGDPVGNNANSTRDKSHPSETAMNDWNNWDFVIVNDGTLDDLIAKVEPIYFKASVSRLEKLEALADILSRIFYYSKKKLEAASVAVAVGLLKDLGLEVKQYQDIFSRPAYAEFYNTYGTQFKQEQVDPGVFSYPDNIKVSPTLEENIIEHFKKEKECVIVQRTFNGVAWEDKIIECEDKIIESDEEQTLTPESIKIEENTDDLPF